MKFGGVWGRNGGEVGGKKGGEKGLVDPNCESAADKISAATGPSLQAVRDIGVQ